MLLKCFSLWRIYAEVVDILKEAATFISSSPTATKLVEMLGCASGSVSF